MARSKQYYPSIDGLRALAVIAVITNHFNENLLPSGYLGVDIFFVISGFVITSSLSNREDKSVRQFIVGFYARRFKRLVPVLALCMMSTSILICLFNPEPNKQLITAITALFGLSNINLYSNAVDYWGDSARLNPFTHTWSLGVEEQFYLVFPLMMWLTVFGRWSVKGRHRLEWLIASFGLASLAGFIYYNDVNQAATYFLMPFRFWELGSGCLLFLVLQKRKCFERNILSSAMPLILMMALVATLFLPLEFNVQATVLVVLFTTVLITFLRIQVTDSSILSYPFIVYIGLISYSLYLWHWMVIVISRWTIGIHWWSAPFQIGITLLLAITSYHYVEKPLRRAKWFSSKRKVAIWGGTVAAIGFASLATLPLTSADNPLYLGAKKEETLTLSEDIQCGTSNSHVRKQIIRTIGDSHSIHIAPMLQQIAEKCDLELITPKAWNSLIIPSGNHSHIDKIAEVFEPLHPNDILIISSRNEYVHSAPLLSHDGAKWYDPSKQQEKYGYGLDYWLEELDIILDLAKDKGINVILFLPNIEFDKKLLPLSVCTEQWFRVLSAGCNPSVSMDYLESRFPKRYFEEVKLRAETNDHFYLFDPLPIYCKDKNQCSRRVNRILAFRDTNHLSKEGALLMLEPFNSFLNMHRLLTKQQPPAKAGGFELRTESPDTR